MKKSVIKVCLVIVAAVLLACMLYACTPYVEAAVERYPILDDEANEANKDHTTKDESIDITCDSMTNLLDYLDSDVVSTTGYYIGADVAINTENNDAFILKLRANLYTYPYEKKDADGNVLYDANGDPLVDEEALAIHNELIKQNDIVLEWYDGMNNTMLIGFYFDGINPNSADPGNNLYLNLQGSKRIFPNFGDSVLYQQIVRLITQFNLASVMGSAAGGTSADAVETVRDLLEVAITTNYKKVLNNDITSIFYNDVSLSIVADDVTAYMQDFFSPFDDKIDPLTKKYLGFSFWTVGNSEITAMLSDMQFFVTPASTETLDKEIMTGMVIDLSGTSRVASKGKDAAGNSYVASMKEVPFTSRIAVDYSVRTSSNIVIDKSDYTLYEYGCYEYIGELFIPYLDLKMDALIRTDMQETDNPDNDIFMQFRDQADDKLLIGLYYENELTYLDISGLEDLYGGIKFEDIGLPKAYKDGINVAELLEWLFDTIDYYIVAMVDELLAPSDGSSYDNLTKAIMDNMRSTEKTDDDPTSRNTIAITVDMDLIRLVLKETSENGTEYTNEQMVDIINQEFNIDLDEIAAILGMNVEQLMETTYFDLTYDVDDYSIVFDLYSTMDLEEGEDAYLILTLDVAPTHLGEKVKIVFPSFDNFNKLQRVYTYSGYLEGEFLFASTEEVDLSDLMGAFIGDLSGKNTQYILPDSAAIYFTMYYDQYIREQILDNGRWTRSGRSAFNIYFYTIVEDERVDLFRIYANDVAFDTSKSVDDFNYVWVDLLCVDDMPKMKIREDLFIESFNMYMGEDVSDDEATVTGLTKIVQALLEDSWPVFEPDVIRITTSNQTIKDFFRVDELIATVSAQIGFTQRVFNIDELESSFAMYTVGEFEDITGVSPYEVELHSTIPVYFDFGSRVEVKNFKFNYNEDSINVTNGKYYYYPEIDGRFMGVTRDYQLVITGGDRGSSKIDKLVESSVVWEPLDDMPATAVATYGNDSAKTFAYKADYEFFATYDKDMDLYIVQNDYGYDIVYDYKNDAYIVGLGTNAKMDKIYNVLDETDTIYLKDYTSAMDTDMLYDLKSGFYGYYVIITDRCRMVYNIVTDTYVILNSSDMSDAKILAGDGATIVTYNTTIDGYNMRYEFSTGYYVVDSASYKILYNPTKKVCYIQDSYDLEVVREYMLGKDVQVVGNDVVNWSAVKWGKNQFNTFDWGRTAWDNIKWQSLTWDDITLSGGKFIMKVTIGKGMMATYEELINVKVTNRVVDTDKYVNINTAEGKVKAPVADSIEVDPYVYILLKADYYNNFNATSRPADFVEWFFSQYVVTIPFTDIYMNSEDTPDEVGNFSFSFDYDNNKRIYSEADINNLVSENSADVTYIYTRFKKQVVAIAVYVQSRTIDYIQIGQEEHNTYTVDSLLESTYTIPANPTIYFKETDKDGKPYTLNFSDYSAEASTIFANSLWTVSDAFLVSGVKSTSEYARENVIVWSDPVADNFKLNWGSEPVRPFKRTSTNVTTSFVDIRNHVDPLGQWFAEDWFSTPIVSVTVLMPNKIVENIDYIAGGNSYTVSDVIVQSDSENGRFYGDPYNTNTWVLPNKLTVNFRNTESETYSGVYDVNWSVIKNDDASNTKLTNNLSHLNFDGGVATLSQMSKAYDNYYLYTQIGNDTIGYIDLTVLVTNRSGNVYRVEFLDASGNVVAGSFNSDPDVDMGGEFTYGIEVDTYARFAMPAKLRVLFDDNSVRTYDSAWGEHNPWVQGEYVTAGSTIGNRNGIYTEVKLTFIIEARTVVGITFPRASGMRESINVDISGKHITVSGFVLKDDKVFINDEVGSLSPYEYLRYLFGEVEVSFATDGTGNPVMIYDVVESAIYDIYRSFDTQIARLTEGEEFIVYLGQGAGADDYTLTLIADKDTPEITAGSIMFGVIEPYDIERNVANYPNGYFIGKEVEISVNYAGTGVRTFAKGSFEKFVVGKPDTLPVAFIDDEDVDGFNGTIKKGDELTYISWQALLGGGYIWVSTMIDDSSRVFIRLEVGGIDIGSNYGSSEAGKLKIENGVVTISDVYAYYPFYESITIDALPKSIVTSGITIPNINWTMTIDRLLLDNITYLTDATYELARATVMDEELVLYLKIMPCVISGVVYTDPTDATKNFSTEDDVFYFDAYKNYGYAGKFTLPKKLRINFQAGGYHDNLNTSYERFNVATYEYEVIDVVTYTYAEHTVENTTSGKYIGLRIKMTGDGQIYEFKVQFYDKTVTKIITEAYSEVYERDYGTITLDPYTPGAYVSSKLIISFNEGDDLYRTVNWTVPDDFEIRYNTYNRILLFKEGNAYSFTSLLTSAGLKPQNLSMSVHVLDRELLTWDLGGYTDVEANLASPNATYHYKDPFAGRASDLPNRLTNIYGGVSGQQDLTTIDIKWNFTDENISAEGTIIERDGKYGDVITGYLGDESYGQQFSIRVYIDRWEFSAIRKPQGDGYIIMNEEIRFYFSRLTDVSAYDTYQVAFSVTDTSTDSKNYYTKNVIFYPSDTTAPTAGKDYILTYDNTAKQKAKSSTEATGRFYLSNSAGRHIVSPATTAYYQYETLYVSEIDLGYGYGADNYAMYVVNPLKPIFNPDDIANNYVSKAQAKGTKNQKYNQDLGEVTVRWPRENFSDSYIKGGIYRGYTVTLELYVGDTVVHTQEFDIMLIFLDMSPVETIEITAGETAPVATGVLHFRDDYTADTYNDLINPYRQSYTAELRAVLNLALSSEKLNLKGNNTIVYTGIKWSEAVPTSVVRDTVIYSASFSVSQYPGVTYYVNALKLIVKPKEE